MKMVRRCPRLVTAVVAVVLAVGVAVPAHAVAPTFGLQQTFSEPGVNLFGTSVSCVDEWAVAGGQGKAVVYHKVRNTWSRFDELKPDPNLADPAADGYGLCVDMDDGIVVVGAPNTDGGNGAAYVYTYSSSQGRWFWTATLRPATPVTGERFGASVSVDGSTIVIGAPGHDDLGGQSAESSVYIFTNTGAWAESSRIDGPPGLPAIDWFGHEVCVYGSTLIVGAPKFDGMAGAAYVYQITDGEVGESQTLRTFNGTTLTEEYQAGNHFGCAVTVRGSTILVGAPGANIVGENPTGGGYVFVYDTDAGEWIAEGEITHPAPAPDFFGYSVALCTDVALVGAHYHDAETGSASFFRRAADVWSHDSGVQLGSGKGAGDWYGYSVDTYCSVAVVGAPHDNGGTGTVYFHTTSKPVPVYRFYNPRAGTHFYTDNQAERDYVAQNLSRYYTWEGTVYQTNPGNNTHSLYRFYNVRNGSHFYTADVAEKDNVIAKLGAIYQYDGPTYLVSLNDGGEGKLPVHRFYNLRNGSHFYTASEAEKVNVIATLGAYYKYEGVAFYLGQ